MPWLLTSHLLSYSGDIRLIYVIGRARLVIHYPSFVHMKYVMA